MDCHNCNWFPRARAWLSPSRLARSFPWNFVLLLFLTSGSAAVAELPLARLWSIFPPGGRAGTTVDVTVTGADLDYTRQILFSTTNITARPKRIALSGDEEPGQFEVNIGASTLPGCYEVRTTGRFGVSNSRLFEVGNLPELIQNQTNFSRAEATGVDLGTIINGRAEPARIAYYQFTARAGQRIIIECNPAHLASRMEPALFLEDGAGHELNQSRATGLLDFAAPIDGNYLLKVHDIMFRGGAEYWYRLALSTGPHLDWILPLRGQPGSKTTFSLYGRNLPGGRAVPGLFVQGNPIEQLEVLIELPPVAAFDDTFVLGMNLKPASATLHAIQYRFRGTNGVSNPMLIALASTPPFVERAPKNSPEPSQPTTLPVEIDGQFYPVGDRDRVTVDLQKGESYWVEVVSQRLGLPTAPFLVLERLGEKETVAELQEIYPAETNTGGIEYSTATRDVESRFRPKATGRYQVQVEDLFNSAPSDPRRVYCLAVRRESPNFQLVAGPQAPPSPDKDRREARVWTTLLRAGETRPLTVLALRRDGFDGEIKLEVEELPSGVHCSPARIESGQSAASLLLTAEADVQDWVGPIRVIGKAKLGAIEAVRIARNASIVWDVDDYSNEAVRSYLTAELMLSVTSQESGPASLRIAQESAFEVQPGTKLEIPLKLVAQSELSGTVKVRAMGSPVLEGMKDFEFSAKTNQAVLVIDLAQHKLHVGSHRLHLVGRAQTKYRRLPAAQVKSAEAVAQAADLAAKEAEKVAAELKEAAANASAAAAAAPGNTKATLEKAAVSASIRAGDAEKRKQQLAETSKAAAQKMKDQELSVTLYSSAFTVNVNPANAVTATR